VQEKPPNWGPVFELDVRDIVQKNIQAILRYGERHEHREREKVAAPLKRKPSGVENRKKSGSDPKTGRSIGT